MTHIFIGYLLVFFHIKINGFDLLPNFLGYALITVGLSKLAHKSDKFGEAKPWATGMSIFTFLICVGQLMGINFSSPIFSILNLLTVPVMLYIIYLIITGVRDIEKNDNLNLGSEKLIQVWKVQSVLNIMCALLSFIPNETIVLLVLLLAVMSIVANIVFLVLLYKAKTIYENT